MKLAELKRKFKNRYSIRIVAGILTVAVLGSTMSAYNVYAAKRTAKTQESQDTKDGEK